MFFSLVEENNFIWCLSLNLYIFEKFNQTFPCKILGTFLKEN